MKFRRIKRYFSSLPKGECALDYGSGDRPLEPLLRTKFREYVAADHPVSNVAHSRRPDISIIDNHVDVDSESVDCVVLTEVMEHCYDPKGALKEIFRVLKPGGAVIGTVPFAIGEHESPYDFYRYTSFCLRRMFDETGFQVVDLDYVGDSIGVAISAVCRAFNPLPKALSKFGLKRLAQLAQLIVRLPEIVYYGAVRIGLDPGRIGYYRIYPIGFAFHLLKPCTSATIDQLSERCGRGFSRN
jgi:SAM-dependent methyltransferase